LMAENNIVLYCKTVMSIFLFIGFK